MLQTMADDPHALKYIGKGPLDRGELSEDDLQAVMGVVQSLENIIQGLIKAVFRIASAVDET